ncbi:uncharacterized protein UDID_18733 [Ustilago sp. UG-2017a]|nr:uncharacterized protein UDID_18733 [Ustilago sp. UG-2017a]
MTEKTGFLRDNSEGIKLERLGRLALGRDCVTMADAQLRLAWKARVGPVHPYLITPPEIAPCPLSVSLRSCQWSRIFDGFQTDVDEKDRDWSPSQTASLFSHTPELVSHHKIRYLLSQAKSHPPSLSPLVGFCFGNSGSPSFRYIIIPPLPTSPASHFVAIVMFVPLSAPPSFLPAACFCPSAASPPPRLSFAGRATHLRRCISWWHVIMPSRLSTAASATAVVASFFKLAVIAIPAFGSAVARCLLCIACDRMLLAPPSLLLLAGCCHH